MVWLLASPAFAFLFRPTLSGPEQVVDFDQFRIHWTAEGSDAPLLADDDGNGRPNSIDAFVEALPAARLAYEAEGWRPIVEDDGDGGSPAIDVYVHQIDTYGYTHSVGGPDGTSCYLELDSALSPDGHVAQSVATHELHHCVEFRYTTSLASWIYEAAATYEQYTHVVDPALSFPLGVLYDERVGSPQRPLGTFDGRFEYSGFLWMKFWSERSGPDATGSGYFPDRLPALWDVLSGASRWEHGLDLAAADAFGADLPQTYLQFAEWNAFACGADDGEHYLPDVLPCVVTRTVPSEAWDGAPVDLAQDDGPYTATYLDLPATDRRIGVTCDGVDGLEVGLVPTSPDGVAGRPVNGFGGDVVAVDGAGGPIRVVVAATADPLSATCETVDVPQGRVRPAGCQEVPMAPFAFAPALALLLRRRVRR